VAYGRIRSQPRRGNGESKGDKEVKNTLPEKRKQEIGRRVRAVRKSLRLEQTELAEKMGVSQAIISQYEQGLTEIPLSFIEYLKKKHRISSDWLIFGTGDNDLKRFEKYLKGKK